MPKTNAETMTVRLPTQIAKELIKLRDEENLPTIGSAVMVYVRRLKEDRIEKRIKELNKSMKEILDRMNSLDDKVRRGIRGPTEDLTKLAEDWNEHYLKK